MPIHVNYELALLKRMTFQQLRQKYHEVYGEPSKSGHRDWLTRRIIWRLQALDEGDMPERAARIRQRAMELARDADLRVRAPVNPTPLPVEPGSAKYVGPVEAMHDDRLPMPGALITREYRGRTVQVRILIKGFEYEGVIYRSLSAVAHAVTGSHWNGWLFFGLKNPRTAKNRAAAP